MKNLLKTIHKNSSNGKKFDIHLTKNDMNKGSSLYYSRKFEKCNTISLKSYSSGRNCTRTRKIRI